MEQKGNRRVFLKWPLNWIVCGLFVMVAGFFIGYLWSALLAALFLWWQKKQNPGAVPQGGYCLDRTRKRLARLVWALLYLLFALAGGVVFYMQLQEDRSAWEISDWAFTVFAAGLVLVFVPLGLYEAYTDFRDALFPGKSRLARSIRSQLPYPDEAPDVSELFAMVDRDIQENGQWFDRAAVGKDWIFGDDVTSVDRVRAVFGRDEIVRHHHGGRTQTSRTVELWILDDRRQAQCTALRDYRELQPLMDCIRLRAPDALYRPYSEYSAYCGKSEEEWQALEREYRQRRAQREQRREERERSAAQSRSDFALTDAKGQRTSRFTLETVEGQLSALSQPGDRFSLEPLEPIPAGGGGLVRMECGITNMGLTLIAVVRREDQTFSACALPVEAGRGLSVLTALLQRREAPDLSGWQPLQAVENRPQQNQLEARLSLSDRTGATREYTSFTRRDLELAADGLASGKYSVAALFFGPYYLYLKAGNQSDGRILANASRPGPDSLRVFETRCSDRQAKQWLLEMGGGEFHPDFSSWKDITKQMEKAQKKAAK